MNRTKLTYLVLPLVLLGCQAIIPGRLSQAPVSDRPASLTVGESVAKPADVPPTVDTTLTAPEAKGAVIATQPEAIAQQPAQFGGLVLNVAWPERPVRRTQAIPSTANSLWIKVYKTKLYGEPKSAIAAPADGTVLASRVIGRDSNDQVPGATPVPCCPDPNAPKKSTLYVSLPAGDVTVWVGTYAETPTAVSTGSVYLSSATTETTIVANKLGSPKSLTLGPNTAVAPNVTQAIPAYVGPGGSFVIKGSNFDDDDLKANLYIAPPSGQTCCSTKSPLAITAKGTDSLTVAVAKDANSQTYVVQIEGKGFVINSAIEVGVLDKNNPFAITFENNAKQFYPSSGMEYALPKGGKLTVTGLTGRIGCCSNDGPALPLSLISIVPPDSATASLDSNGAYTLANIGQYKVVAVSGEAKYTQKVNAFNVKFSVDTSDWDGGSTRDQLAFPVATLVSPPCPTCNYDLPAKLYYFIRDGVFVDAQDNPLNNIGNYQASDFAFTSDTLTLNSGSHTITGGSAATGTLTATLKASSTITATTSVRVYAPASVKLSSDYGYSPTSGQTFNYTARLMYSHSSDNTKYELGKDEDFEWTSSNTAVATVDPNSGAGQMASSLTTGDSTVITATLRNDTSKKATVTITAQ